MRTTALSVTVCGLVLAVARIAAGSDFDALLQDLSFGNEPKAEQPIAAKASVDRPAVGPESNGFTMPGAEQLVVAAASTPLVAMQELIEDSGSASDTMVRPEIDFDQVFTSQEATESDDALARIESVPAPEQSAAAPPAPMPMDSDVADAEPMPMVPQPITDPVHLGPCDSCAADHGCANHGCGHVVTCRPHLPPNLPHSTLLQYFRSNACTSNVWQGYQQKCGLGQHHVNGTCDCFNPNRKGCFGVKSCQCGSCDACDR